MNPISDFIDDLMRELVSCQRMGLLESMAGKEWQSEPFDERWLRTAAHPNEPVCQFIPINPFNLSLQITRYLRIRTPGMGVVLRTVHDCGTMTHFLTARLLADAPPDVLEGITPTISFLRYVYRITHDQAAVADSRRV